MRKLKNHTNQKLITIAVLLLLAISIGYAALSTTLTINGTANIASNSWLIYFTNVQVTIGSVTATTTPTTVGTSTTTLTWAVNLQTPGDFYEYYVDVKNDGTIDAMIGSLSNSSLTTNQAKYLAYTVTYDDGATIEQYDKLDSGDTVTLKVRVEYKTDLNPEDLPSEPAEITFEYTSNYVQADGNAKARNAIASLNIGDTINYITSMNGVTLKNWRIFYIDGDYTILILEEYLPRAAIDTSKVEFTNVHTYGSYSISSVVNRRDLLDALLLKSNWTELLTGTINGTPIDYSGTTDTNIWAMGSPTLDLYVNSWNTKYPSDKIFIAQSSTAMSDGFYGYYVGTIENPTTDLIDYSVKEGYNNTLYYPHQELVDECFGYWLASPSDADVLNVFCEDIDGFISGVIYCGNEDRAVRPVISLPTSIIRDNMASKPIGKVSDTYEIGDYVSIYGEGFYVIEDSPANKTTVKLLASDFVNVITNKQDVNANPVIFDNSINTYANSYIEGKVVSYVESLGIDVISCGLLSCDDMDSLSGYDCLVLEYDDTHGYSSWWLDSPGCDDGYAWSGGLLTESDGGTAFYDWFEINDPYYYLRPYIEIQKSNIPN